MLILQQPRSHIPLYEADYEVMNSKKHRGFVSSHVHVASAPRASARLERQRFKLPVKPSTAIVQHNKRVESFVSVSPFDARFPVLSCLHPRILLFSVSPWDARFPSFRSSRVSVRQYRPLLDSDEKTLEFSSFSPFHELFPSRPNRRHRNRASKRHRLQAAIAQYRRERGPVAKRPLFNAEDRKYRPIDPSIVSYSPWQEVEFALLCGIALPNFVHSRKLKNATIKAAEILKPKLMKTKKPRYLSYSPFNPLFPFAIAKNSGTVASTAIVSYAFPAYSPMAKQHEGSNVSFKLPNPTQVAPEKLPRQTSLHMH